jgi:DNA modification methylase
MGADSSIEDVLEGRARWCCVHGDCLDVMRAMPDRSVAHVMTDPPYGEHVHVKPWQSRMLGANGDRRAASEHAGIDFAHLTAEQANEVAGHARRVTARWSLFFADLEGIALWRTVITGNGLDYVRTCVWDKVDSSPQFTGDRPASAAEAIVCAHQPGRKKWNGGGRRNVFRFEVNGDRGGKPHPTTKPAPLMLELVSLFTDPDDIILDPFAGSGTTGVAALRLGRRVILIEKDAKYAALCRERMQAEEQGSTLQARRAGQLPLLG